MHRQNVWNDITEADPDDLPPPFPEGAPRPPTPPLPPTHSEAANDAQLIGPQPHARIPDSPPPPFVSDSEGEDEPATDDRAPRPAEQPASVNAAGETGSPTLSRSSSRSSASLSDEEVMELTEERRAWEADIRNGLSFEVRMLREQQRRVARERAAAVRARASDSRDVVEVAVSPERQQDAPAAAESVAQPTISSTLAENHLPTAEEQRMQEDQRGGEEVSAGATPIDTPPPRHCLKSKLLR